MAMNVRGLLQDIAEYQSTESFTKDFIREDNMQEREENGLGIAIANWAGWDGSKIMRVFQYAMEDANYPEVAAAIDELAKYADGEDDDGPQ